MLAFLACKTHKTFHINFLVFLQERFQIIYQLIKQLEMNNNLSYKKVYSINQLISFSELINLSNLQLINILYL